MKLQDIDPIGILGTVSHGEVKAPQCYPEIF